LRHCPRASEANSVFRRLRPALFLGSGFVLSKLALERGKIFWLPRRVR
jgi:hypothetical protein